MTVQEIFAAIDGGLAEVSRQLASGELDRSGRYYTDAELKAQAEPVKPIKPVVASIESGT